MMKIIHTNATVEQSILDGPELERLHADAMRNSPTWAMFGGTLTVDGRDYQVIEAPEKRHFRIGENR
jgi:hypothetical protein